MGGQAFGDEEGLVSHSKVSLGRMIPLRNRDQVRQDDALRNSGRPLGPAAAHRWEPTEVRRYLSEASKVPAVTELTFEAHEGYFETVFPFWSCASASTLFVSA